ncbi:helix-turn-helix transcriptional regulator [Thiobacillus denitrificans]|uniref:AlpA family transcriptional regulator n=1 Tax=Thiobacillus denitrificans TaxID=36861 RepID=A0A106BJ18_THIDE|nr:AlpA family transcriptional regulator [Thiobacillus denitrificans]KVW93330.1 AlpA family transcriptional regulator [Thiobacillus denitrificans]
MVNIIRLPDVMARTGLSRSSVFLKVKTGDMPPPIKLGVRATGWVAEEVDNWIKQRVAASRPTPRAEG